MMYHPTQSTKLPIETAAILKFFNTSLVSVAMKCIDF